MIEMLEGAAFGERSISESAAEQLINQAFGLLGSVPPDFACIEAPRCARLGEPFTGPTYP